MGNSPLSVTDAVFISFSRPIMSQSSTSTKEGRGIFFKSAASQKHEGTFVYASKVFDANLQEFFPSKTIIPHDKWTFIAVSYTSKDCLLFVDGSSATSPIKNAIFNDNINFGATSTSQFGFSGLIDEAIVLNEALSQAQLTILMMSSQYSSENIVSVHPAGFALSFAAEGTAVLSLGDSSSMSSLDAFTVSMWVKPVPSVDKRHMCLVTKGNLHHPEYAICLTYRIDMANDPTKKNAWRVTVALASSEETSAAELEDSNFLNAKWESIWHSKASLHIRQWSRLDIVWDGNICSIAVNNVVRDQVELDLRNTGKDSTSPLVVGGFASFKDSDLASINIGNLFQGEIDELYFWKYPLNVQQFGLRRIDPGLHIQEKLLFGYWAFNDGRGFLASNEVDVGKHWSLNFLSGNFSTSTLPKWVVSTVPLETSLNVDSENATPVRVFAADIEFETLTGTISTLPEGVNLFHSINEDNVSAAVDWSRPINTADEKFPVFRPEWSLDYYSAALSENVLAGTVSLWIVPRITDTNIASVLKYYVNQAQGAINIFVKASPPDSAIQLPKRIPMIYKGINLTDIDAEEEL